MAGTVEIESARARAQAPLAADLTYGSRRAIAASASASATLARGEGAATLSATYARGDGFFPTLSGSRGPADRPASYEQFSAAARTVIVVGAQTELQANLSGFTDTRERGTAFTRNRSEGADASVRLVGRETWGWSACAYLQTRAFASQFASVDAARTVASPTLKQYNTPATGAGGRTDGRFELVAPVGQGRDVRFGADVRRVDGRTQENYSYVAGVPTRLRVGGGAALTYGLFADSSAELGDLTLTLGGRIDQWRLNDGVLHEKVIATGVPLSDARFAERRGTEWTGRAGAAWAPMSAVTLRAAGYCGWRLPTLNELYRPFRVGADATTANAAPDPEGLVGVDGGGWLLPRPPEPGCDPIDRAGGRRTLGSRPLVRAGAVEPRRSACRGQRRSDGSRLVAPCADAARPAVGFARVAQGRCGDIGHGTSRRTSVR